MLSVVIQASKKSVLFWQFYYFEDGLFSGVDGVSLTGPYKKLKKP